LAVVGIFLLRLGVPLAITLAVGYWLRRLDAKWEAEALGQWEEEEVPAQAPAEAEWVVIAPARGPLANVYVQAVGRKFPIGWEFLAIL